PCGCGCTARLLLSVLTWPPPTELCICQYSPAYCSASCASACSDATTSPAFCRQPRSVAASRSATAATSSVGAARIFRVSCGSLKRSYSSRSGCGATTSGTITFTDEPVWISSVVVAEGRWWYVSM